MKLLQSIVAAVIAFLTSYNGKQAIYAVIMNLIAGVATYLSLEYMIELSSFGVGMLKFSISIAFWVLFDIFVLKGIDTLEELKKGNISVGLLMGLYLVAMSIVIGFS